MKFDELKKLSITDLWALRQFLDGKNNVLKRAGDEYVDEIKESQLIITVISMILSQRIETLKQDFKPRKMNDAKI